MLLERSLFLDTRRACLYCDANICGLSEGVDSVVCVAKGGCKWNIDVRIRVTDAEKSS